VPGRQAALSLVPDEDEVEEDDDPEVDAEGDEVDEPEDAVSDFFSVDDEEPFAAALSGVVRLSVL
jgi:hypothetical protein